MTTKKLQERLTSAQREYNFKLKKNEIRKHSTYSSQDLSQTVSNKSMSSDSGKGFPFRDGFFSSAFFSAFSIYKVTKSKHRCRDSLAKLTIWN